MLVELASKSVRSLRLNTGWKITAEKFEEVSIKEGTTLNEGSQSPNISSSFDNSMPQNSENATGSFANSESNVITDEQNEFAPSYSVSSENDIACQRSVLRQGYHA